MTTQVSGDLHIANDVLADIAGNAAMECYGVVGMAAPNVADTVQKILRKEYTATAKSAKTCSECDFRFYCGK